MANTTYGSPYVQSSDLVSGWPATSLSVADRIDDVSFKGNGVNNQTATYATVLTDAGKTIVMNVGSANDLTIQASGTAAYETGTMIRIVNKGSGATTVKPAGGVTLNGGNIILAQNQSATVVNVATDIWSPVSTPAAATASGLTLIIANTFSSASGVSINSCFSATYENYKILISNLTTASAGNLIFRFRASGTDYSTGNYNSQRIEGSAGTVTGITSLPTTSLSPFFLNNSTTASSASIEIYQPFASVVTGMFSNANRNDSGTSITTSMAGNLNVTTSYDGFSIYPGSGTFSGTVRVFGYQNS